MSYTPTEWETADIVTATRMNALETAVGDMNMSYTPNTWSDGDILTAAKMNALEQAVASGGGGGSSDFSTATVTINAERTTGCAISSTVVDVSSSWDLEPNTLPPIITLLDTELPQGVSTYTVVLYQGHTLVSIYADEVAVQGSAQQITDIEYAVVLDITGDCTITIS